MMTDSTSPKPIFLKDYEPPAYLIDTVDLSFDIHEDYTEVESKLSVQLNDEVDHEKVPLILDGEELELKSIAIDGETLTESQYNVKKDQLWIYNVPAQFQLTLVNRIYPHKNTQLEGLYRSQNLFCTQCESHGFRRITYFIDRPDVMSVFTTHITADTAKYPVLLGNGNCVSKKRVDESRETVTYHDPFKKPAYLFALVAGDLSCVKETYITQAGREISLEIYVRQEHKNYCGIALSALKKAMQWDEERFSLAYDLNTYKIVAVDDFNMGAMENKGLNIFNAKYILASQETATDHDQELIEAVVGHEYFHNWTGNRVTLRDWFQLSLKEGLTVFREQAFCEAVQSRAINRIMQASLIRQKQFPEDKGPLAHPVRPESYIEMNNFYTLTVYEKGAEIIRMLETLLGRETFDQGLRLYLERHDGCAVTVEAFLKAMADVSHRDLSSFSRWYAQSGTPELTVTAEYDSAAATYTLDFVQKNPDTADQKNKQPLHIPVKIALLAQSGDYQPLSLANDPSATSMVLEITKAHESFTFHNVSAEPVPSLLQDFSAPVELHTFHTNNDWLFIAQHEQDPYARWQATQAIFKHEMMQFIKDGTYNPKELLTPIILALFQGIFDDDGMDHRFASMLLKLPTMTDMSHWYDKIPVNEIVTVQKALKQALAENFKETWWQILEKMHITDPYTFNPAAVGRRAYLACCLDYLSVLEDTEVDRFAYDLYHNASNMTDTVTALTAILHRKQRLSDEVLAHFYKKHRNDAQVMDKWFSLQAGSAGYGRVVDIAQLASDPLFDISNPNKVSSLYGVFAAHNFAYFHQETGKGYTLLVDCIRRLDPINPLTAARLLRHFSSVRSLSDPFRTAAFNALDQLRAETTLSKDVYELTEKIYR